MKIALAQINSTLGDFAGNGKKILEYLESAVDRKCDLIVFPEAALFGYHPVDLLERESVVHEQLKELKKIEKKMPHGIAALLGAITLNPGRSGKPFHNSAVFLQKGKKPKIFAKELLPTYDVFDEGRHIEPGDMSKNILKFKGKKILITICEDIWAWTHVQNNVRVLYKQNPIKKLKNQKIQLILNLSASPFTDTKLKGRQKVCRLTAAELKAPLVYVNMVGAQDELVFDGGSFVTSMEGKVVAQARHFMEELLVYDTELGRGFIQNVEKLHIERVRQALVLGVSDFLRKTGFSKAHIGISGGIDSALVACLLVDAIGPQNVSGLILPGPYTSKDSLILARDLANHLQIKTHEFNITPLYEKYLESYKTSFSLDEFSIVNENLQARLRGLSLMAFSNQHNSLLINTSNKSELAMGYSTLYGDLIGALCPIGDLTKSEVFKLSNHYNKEYEVIPQKIIDRSPSAELRPNQKDSDTLPEYNILDPLIVKVVEHYKVPKSQIEKKILLKMMQNEFKRWQAPPILKVTNHAFGRGRRLPIAHKAYF